MNKSIKTLLLIIPLLEGCCPCRHIATDTRMDSTRVEVRTETILVPDTVYIEIPAQKSERTTTKKESHLENDYATSDARINNDGTLFHNLMTKQQKKAVETNKIVEKQDSIVYRAVYKDKIVTKEVEKDLSWWQRTQIYGFWIAIILLIITYRESIYSFIVRLFLKK